MRDNDNFQNNLQIRESTKESKMKKQMNLPFISIQISAINFVRIGEEDSVFHPVHS